MMARRVHFLGEAPTNPKAQHRFQSPGREFANTASRRRRAGRCWSWPPVRPRHDQSRRSFRHRLQDRDGSSSRPWRRRPSTPKPFRVRTGAEQRPEQSPNAKRYRTPIHPPKVEVCPSARPSLESTSAQQRYDYSLILAKISDVNINPGDCCRAPAPRARPGDPRPFILAELGVGLAVWFASCHRNAAL